MQRVVLVLPSKSYRTTDFVGAAHDLGIEVAVATEGHQTFAADHPDRYVEIDLASPRRAAAAIIEWAQAHPVTAVLGVDDLSVLIAAIAGEGLGLTHNPPSAVAATRNKAMMRRALKDVVPQPSFTTLAAMGEAADEVAHVGLPAVIKPLSLAASRGVIKVDRQEDAAVAAERIRRILAAAGGNPNEALLVERFITGQEVAIDGLLMDGTWHTLAVFDKPDPLDGPYFPETLYVTPSRHHPEVVHEIERVAATAAAGLGLREGAVHAEVRIHGSTVVFLELAARSIGGLCGRTMRFGLLGNSLESLLLRHATGAAIRSIRREQGAAGVAMIPVPQAGVFDGFDGIEDAKQVDEVTEVEVSVAPGTRVRPLPDDGTYLGFVFARASNPDHVEAALREAVAQLRPVIRETGASRAARSAGSDGPAPTDPRSNGRAAP